jgi:uncharacterized membrane protein YkgB
VIGQALPYAAFIGGLAILGAFITILSFLSSIIQQWISNEAGAPEKEETAAQKEKQEGDYLHGERIIGSLPSNSY